jgi:hypothetical protein
MGGLVEAHDYLAITPAREAIITPLLKWKILGLSELKELSLYKGRDSSFRRIILRCEENKLIESFRHPSTQRKFLHLGSAGRKAFVEEGYFLNQDTKYHDALVSNVLHKFLALPVVGDVSINNPDFEYNRSIFSDKLDEDGRIQILRRNKLVTLAVEVELTRKSSKRIIEKFKHYHFESSYPLVIYFFNNRSTMKVYKEYLNNFCSEADIKIEKSIITFCYLGNIDSGNLNIAKAEVHGRGKRAVIEELFL